MFLRALSVALTVGGLTAATAQGTVRYVDADAPAGGDNSENSYHVVTGNGTDETTILDGVTMTAGNAGWPWDWEGPITDGGGMYHGSRSPW